MIIQERVLCLLAMVFVVLGVIVVIAWIVGRNDERMINRFAVDNKCEAVVKAYTRLQIDIGCRDGRTIHYMR